MMNYGSTPWGKLFLDALHKHYYSDSGRLNRGKSYANTGKVKSIKIDNSKIEARIQGQELYKTSIFFTPFAEDIKTKIINAIKNNPSFLADITNGVLGNDFLENLNDQNIDIFPKNWDKLERDCSCPDWGDPCKHLAALYFVIVNEIDKNPFLIFELRGINLKKEFDISEILEIKSSIVIQIQNDKPVVFRESVAPLLHNDYLPFILSMLPQSVPYLERDFKEMHSDFYKKYHRESLYLLSSAYTKDSELCEKIFKEATIAFYTNKDELFFTVTTPFIGELINKFPTSAIQHHTLTLDALVTARLFLSFKDDKGSDSYYYLFNAFSFLYEITRQNSFIFDVKELKDGYYAHLKALDSLVDIREKLELLYKMTPQIVAIENIKDNMFLTQKSQTDVFLSSMLSYIARQINFVPSKGKAEEKELLNAIFSCKKIPNSAHFSNTLAKSIDNSYEIFNIKSADFVPTILIDTEDGEDYIISISIDNKPLCKAIETDKSIAILRYLNLFRPLLPEIQNLERYEQTTLDLQRLKEFLTYSKEYLVNLGFQIALPKELLSIFRPKPILKAKSRSSGSKLSFFNLDTLLEFDYKIAIGDYEIDTKELEALISKNSEFLKFKEIFVLIDPKEAQKLLTATKKQLKLNSFEVLSEFLSDNLIFDAPTARQIEEMLKPKKVEISKNLRAELREYQTRGVEWSINNLLNGFGVVLADDMGLGKTVQTIAVLLHLKESGTLKNALIIVPTTLLNNWEAELKKFAPTLTYSIYYGSKRELDTSCDLIISTYQLITRDIEKISKLTFDLTVIDEAQNIKNIETKTTKAINTIKSTHKIALSGTPVENNLSELWSIFHFAIPGFLGTHSNFSAKYAKRIEVDRDVATSERLKKITSPFMLRRLKSDKSIISDLPEKIIIDELASMTPAQSALYKATVDDSMRRLEENENAKAEIFRLIIALKQICNHPRNFDKQSPLESGLSGKTELLMTILEPIVEKGEKVLIFTQYTQMGEILEKLIEKELKTQPLFFHGGLSKTKRDEMIEEFKDKYERKILILSLKAGGVGLNLTQASNVIHYDLWFNPAVENQATDRAFRIGQQKNVTVYRFITKNSFEERIDAMIKSKKELANLSVSSGENWLGDMSKDEIKELFLG